MTATFETWAWGAGQAEALPDLFWYLLFLAGVLAFVVSDRVHRS